MCLLDQKTIENSVRGTVWVVALLLCLSATAARRSRYL
jgi:hypothetical protein